MKINNLFRIILGSVGILMVILVSVCCNSGSSKDIIIENRYFKYEISRNGKNICFIDKVAGIDYLNHDFVSYCAVAVSDGKEHPATSVSMKRNLLTLEFGETGVVAEIIIRRSKDYINLKVAGIKGQTESLTFINIPLLLEGMPYESFAACVLSMNLFTHVRQLPALQTHLWATCYERFGLKGAEITMIGIPMQQILPVIRKVMENADEVPHSDKGGAWAQLQKEGYGSYLMNFGTLTEETIDEWIATCSRLGFNQIDNHGGTSFFRFGDLEIDTVKWPGGWDSFKRINERLHQAGISSIFHTYGFFIDKDSKYVKPVPSEDLGYFNIFTLTEPVDSEDIEITVKESTADLSLTKGFFVRNSTTLRIGGELIEYTGITKSPPYKFTGCKRGANGTVVSAHGIEEKAYHLREMFGRFVPGPETELFDEIASHTAEIVNNCDFDGIYFDAIDGSDILAGEENFWYYGTKFIFEVAGQLKRPVGMEMSSMSHHWWHYRSRWQAWDRPMRGYKRFIDIHSAAIKSAGLFLPSKMRYNEYEHGIWRGHTPIIDKFATIENGSLLLPLHFGWWGNQTWNPPMGEPTFPDDVEYLCCKMIGNNAGISMLGGVDQNTLQEYPLFARLIPIIRQYEELRHKNYFNDTVKRILRQPGKEFTLFQEDNGQWNFKPITYSKHKVEGISHSTATWTIHNEYEPQPVKLRIEPLMSVKRYNHPENIILAGSLKEDQFSEKTSIKGVSGGLKITNEKTPGGEVSMNFYATSNGESPREGSWLKIDLIFDPWLDLSKNQALGAWVKGDGNGELLNLRLESPRHLTHGARGDHFVKIDFTGWKYFELVEVESSEASNYIWPDSGFYVYDSYRHMLQFNSINKLQLWYNNLPEGKDVSCLLGPVKALPLVPVTIENPTIQVGDKAITFPVKMESGMYLEFWSPTDCKLYGPKGELLKEISIEDVIPNLVTGDNEISLKCSPLEEVNARVQVTIISEGKPLKN
jgi:hypothetical protein